MQDVDYNDIINKIIAWSQEHITNIAVSRIVYVNYSAHIPILTIVKSWSFYSSELD